MLLVAALLFVGTSASWAATEMTTMTGTLGLTDCSATFAAYNSKHVTIAAGESYVYTLVNNNKGASGTDLWENWAFEANNGTKYLDFRADGGYWGELPTATSYTGSTSTTISSTATEWLQAYNGVTVTITVSRSNDGTTLTVAHTATTNAVGTIESQTYAGTYTATISAEDEITGYLTCEDSYSVINKVVYTPASGSKVNYELKNIDLSAFDSYGSGSYADGTATFTIGSSKQWCKLDMSSYYSGISGTITDINLKFTENLGSDGRIAFGIYGNNKTSWATNAYQDAGNCVSVWGITGSSYTTRIYYSSSSTYTSGVTYGSATAIEVDMDLINKKFTWIQAGTTKVNNQSFVDTEISMPQYFGVYSWSANTSSLTDMTMEIVYLSATYYTATFTETNSLSPTVKIYTDSGRTEEISNGLLEDATTYYYTATLTGYNDYEGSFTVNGANPSVEFTMIAKSQFTYNVYAVNSSSVTLQDDPIATATVYEDETAELKWSKYIKIGEQWYVTSETSFYTTATEAGSKNVVYEKADIAYFFEMESLTRSGGVYLTEENSSYSNNSRLRLSKGSLYYTSALAAGVYTISIPWENGNESSNEVYVYTRSSEGTLSDVLETFTASKGFGTFTATIKVSDGYSIAFNGNEGSVNNNARMDYMVVTQATVSKTMTAAGWATFCSPYALDFSSSITNLTKAYTITGASGSTLTLSEITGTIPANTGILLNGTAGTIAIPAVASSSTDVSTNKLVGVTSETSGVAAGIYVLMNGTNGVGFYQTTNAFTVGANTAYLPSGFDSTGARDFFLFSETTGINSVQSSESSVQSEYYNLAGQRVAQPTKGLYIVNGKKVVVK